MGKIWMKTRFDAGMNMEIPHSINIANAMFGFREMGAEIVPYHLIDEIYESVEREDIVLDYIDQCNAIFRKLDVTPRIPDYPDVFREFMGRRVWRDTINSIANDESKWSAGYFVKPLRSKAFTGRTISSIADLVGCGNWSEDYEVLVSEPLDIMAEWRCFVLYDRLLDVRPYGLLLDGSREGYYYHYDSNVLRNMMTVFRQWEDRPASCAMDICLTQDGKTLLVEFNDSYALGCYGLPQIYYAKMISARWSQLLGRKDDFCFGT